MTDRAQPGAIDSIIRNDELGEALAPFMPGAIIPGSDPSRIAQRRSDIDETALNAFDISVSSSSLDVTVDAGEAYVSGWCCRDVSTTLTLPQNTTSEIVVGWNSNAIFDPEVDADRDAADETIVDLGTNVDADVPSVVAWEVTTDGSGVTDTTRIAPVGALSVSELIVQNNLTVTQLFGDACEFDTAFVRNAPSTADEVARKAELDGKASATHASTHGEGGADVLDAGSLPATTPTQIHTTTSDPTADVGEIWYRSDLD